MIIDSMIKKENSNINFDPLLLKVDSCYDFKAQP